MMTKSLVMSVGLAALVFSGVFSLNQSQHDAQKVSAQSDDRHFNDCRSRLLDMANRYSRVLDRYENGEDVRTDMSSVLGEGFVIFSDCEDVRDRLFQDPAVKFQTDYLNERLNALGLGNATGLP
jgi:hypothetical protein